MSFTHGGGLQTKSPPNDGGEYRFRAFFYRVTCDAAVPAYLSFCNFHRIEMPYGAQDGFEDATVFFLTRPDKGPGLLRERNDTKDRASILTVEGHETTGEEYLS